jgi:hypothetical protein
MKVLCLYYDTEKDWLAADPLLELEGMGVVLAHTFEEAMGLIEEKVMPFDIFLTDPWVPYSDEIDDLVPTSELCSQANINLVRGIGVFVPTDCNLERIDTSDSFTVLVAASECLTPDGKRDWKKLLGMVEDNFSTLLSWKIRGKYVS